MRSVKIADGWIEIRTTDTDLGHGPEILEQLTAQRWGMC